MDASTAFAVYAMAAVVFAVPAYVAALVVYSIIVEVVALVRHLRRPTTIEIVEPVAFYAVPEGMTFEQFDAWLSSLPAPHNC